jgi:DNA-binding NtrC family response regulator
VPVAPAVAGGGTAPIMSTTASSPDGAPTFDLTVLEGETIRRALEHTSGHRARAAKLLGISERTLRNKLSKDH